VSLNKQCTIDISLRAPAAKFGILCSIYAPFGPVSNNMIIIVMHSTGVPNPLVPCSVGAGGLLSHKLITIPSGGGVTVAVL
jgi:hypothetical protein